MWLSQSVLLVNVVNLKSSECGVLTEKLGLSEFFFPHSTICCSHLLSMWRWPFLNEVSSEVSFAVASKGEEGVEVRGLEHI